MLVVEGDNAEAQPGLQPKLRRNRHASDSLGPAGTRLAMM